MLHPGWDTGYLSCRNLSLPYAFSGCRHCPKETTPQRKRYEPAWLAGTSVGDIMFQVHETCEKKDSEHMLHKASCQADYFLKELALGEYTMPIVGMMLPGCRWKKQRSARCLLPCLLPQLFLGAPLARSVFDWSEMTDANKTWAGREWSSARHRCTALGGL